MNALLWREALGGLDAEFCLLLTQAIVHFVWQGCVVALLYFIFDIAWPRTAAKNKCLGGVVALLLMAACLPVTMAIQASGVTANVLSASPVGRDADSIAALQPNDRPLQQQRQHNAGIGVPVQILKPEVVDTSQRTVSELLAMIAPYTTIIYFCRCALMLLRVSAGFLGGQRLRAAATPCDDPVILHFVAEQARRLQVRLVPPVAWCARLSTPVVVGVLQPIILLPPALAAGLTSHQLGAVLLHELAHIRRYDLAINLLQRLIEAVLFFHPAVWWLSRRVSCEAEIACDDLATTSDYSKFQYAEALIRSAELCEMTRILIRPPSVALAATDRNVSQFKYRVLRLLGIDEQPQMRPSTAGLILSVAMIILLFVAPAAWRSVAMAENEPKPANSQVTKPKTANGETPPEKKAQSTVAPSTKTTPLSISGRALNSEGQPIQGAKIYVASRRVDYKRLSETTTDEQGQYEFRDVPMPLEQYDRGSGSGAFEVFGQAEGHGFAWRTTKHFYAGTKPNNMVPGLDEPQNFDSTDNIVQDLKFSPAATLKGRLVDDLGQPIPNATLDIRYADSIPASGYGPEREFRIMSPSDEFEALNERSTVPPEMKIRKTDAEGKFEFTGLPPNCRFRIDVRPPGFAQRPIFAATQKGVENTGGYHVYTDGMEIIFWRPIRVPIQVLYGDTGKPAPKALITSANMESQELVTTDADGKATLRIPPGEHHLRVLPEYGTPYLPTDSEGDVTVNEKSADSLITLRLKPAAVVELTVVDADTGKGLANVDYWVADAASPQNKIDHFSRSWEVAKSISHVDRSRTDANGKMRILFEPGSYQIGVGSQYFPRGYQPVEPEGLKIDCEAGKKLEFTFQLRSAGVPAPNDGGQTKPNAAANATERAFAGTPIQP